MFKDKAFPVCPHFSNCQLFASSHQRKIMDNQDFELDDLKRLAEALNKVAKNDHNDFTQFQNNVSVPKKNND